MGTSRPPAVHLHLAIRDWESCWNALRREHHRRAGTWTEEYGGRYLADHYLPEPLSCHWSWRLLSLAEHHQCPPDLV